ncbi:MAG: 50S ribosomal protein L21 [Simkaniaceae bacterium]|nr:50S ribosomal protein L21 [Simkaniaceae bacterium]
MYAIIKTGGKQYRVEKGDVIQVELLLGVEKGPVDFDNVLFLNDGKAVKIGMPNLENCTVKGELLAEVKGPKVIAYKYKRRKSYRRKVGHRQKYSQVKILDIVSS